METLSKLLARWSVDSPHKGPVIWGIDILLVVGRIQLTKSKIAGDFRRHGAHTTSLWRTTGVYCALIPWWRHQKWKNFPRYWPLCGEFTGHQWIPLPKASDAKLWCFFICGWINGWINNREAGDLSRHRAHYDVIVKQFIGRVSWDSLSHNRLGCS